MIEPSKNILPEEYGLDDIIERGRADYKNNLNKNMSNINWHSFFTYLSWVIVFVVGGLSALKGNGVGTGIITSIISVLGIINHNIGGNTQ